MNARPASPGGSGVCCGSERSRSKTRRIVGAPATASTKVLILTTFDHDEYVFEALRAGASGFLLKDTLPVELLSAVKIVAAGDALLAPCLLYTSDAADE